MASRLMGILNRTPDSFYDRGRWWHQIDVAIARGIEIYNQGADIIDIGGESTRPNASPVSESEELERVIPLIEALKKVVPIPISIDTMKAKVAEAAIVAGATLINDVSGFRDPAMRKIAVESKLPICVMHMLGSPQTMQSNPIYPGGVVNEVIEWLQRRVELLINEGVDPSQIILDPGIGFGKTVNDNLTILREIQQFKALGFPLLIGVSRKSFLRKILNKPAEDLLPGTLAVNLMVLQALKDNNGIIRVHDVMEHRDMMKVVEILTSSENLAIE